MNVVQLLAQLLRAPAVGKPVVPIVADEARTFGMQSLFRQIGIYSSSGQLYEPEDHDELLYYRETGIQPRQNLGDQGIRSNAALYQLWKADAGSNFSRLLEYVSDPAVASPLDPDDALKPRVLENAKARQRGREPLALRVENLHPLQGCRNTSESFCRRLIGRSELIVGEHEVGFLAATEQNVQADASGFVGEL